MNVLPQQEALNLEALIDRSKISPFQWRIFIICFFLVLMEGFDIAIVAYIAPLVQQEMNLSADSLAYLFGAGVFGLMFGGMVFGPISDYFGRKKVLVLTTFIYAISTLTCAFITDYTWFVFLRLLTGFGLGGAMPISIALCVEYAPKSRRMALCTFTWSGFTAGIALGGILASWIISDDSWRVLLMIGGGIPLLYLFVIKWALPESLQFLLMQNNAKSQLEHIISKISPLHIDVTQLKCSNLVQQARPISHLLSKDNLVLTLLLWLAFFLSLFAFYLLTYWLPILTSKFYDLKAVNRLTSMLPLGGTVGAFILAFLIDRHNRPFVLLSSAYLLASVFLLLVGEQLHHYNLLLLLVFMVGFMIAGAQNSLNLISASVYENSARATGVSWAMASGRLGSVVGSYLGAWLLSNSQTPERFFQRLAISTTLCGFALLGIWGLMRFRKIYIKNGVHVSSV